MTNPLPSVTHKTIVGTYVDSDGNRLMGYVTFAPSVRLTAVTDNAAVLPTPVRVDVSGGAMTVTLPVNDDPDLLPNGFTYEVVENFPGNYSTYHIAVTSDMPDVVDITDIAPVVFVTPDPSYVLSTQVGQVGGPAGPLDANGQIPAAQIPGGGGGEGAGVASVNGRTGVVTLTKADVGLSSVDNTADADKPVSTATAAALTLKIDKSTVTTKGDLLVATAASTITRLPVGANDQVLTADSTTASGVAWKPAPGSAAGAVLLDPAGSNVGTTDPSNSWLDLEVAYSAGDTNADQLRFFAGHPSGGARIKTSWANGNFEWRFAPSTTNRVALRVFEMTEAAGLGPSTGDVFQVSTNPTVAANREFLFAVRGTGAGSLPGWAVCSRGLSAPNLDNSAWTNLTLLNGVTASAGFETPASRLEHGGAWVRLKGRIDIPANTPASTNLFQIAVGAHRPALTRGFSVRTGPGGNLATIMQIDASGNASLLVGSGGSASYLFLDGISFGL